MDLLDEMAQHLLCHVEIGDHPILQRTDRLDRARCTAEHPLGLNAYGMHLAGPRVDRDDARLRQHDPSPAYVNERIGGSKIDRHVAAAESG